MSHRVAHKVLRLLELTMSRILAACASAAVLAATAPAYAGGAHTTRIEESNAYGATVTIEEGVRVFRPLPSDRHVIVNPGGRTPLSVHTYDPGIPPYNGDIRR
jgi:hypothetical protein